MFSYYQMLLNVNFQLNFVSARFLEFKICFFLMDPSAFVYHTKNTRVLTETF